MNKKNFEWNPQIYYEDCIEGMKNRIKENSIDLLIADPPFGIKFDGKQSNYNRRSHLVVDGYNEISPEKYPQFTKDWIGCIPRILKDTGSGYIISGFNQLKHVLEAIDESGLTLINHIIWKFSFGVYTKRKYTTSHYHILFVVKHPKKYFFHRIDKYAEDVWEIDKTYNRGKKKRNATKLPQELINKMIRYSSKIGDVICDPFLGNGTTACCAKGLYRNCIGFEINQNGKKIIEEHIDRTLLGHFYTSVMKPMSLDKFS